MGWQREQDKRLREFIKIIYHHHPYYHALMKKKGLKPEDFKKTSDLIKLPITYKKDVLKDPKKFVLQPKKDELKKTLGFKQKIKGLVNPGAIREQLSMEYQPTTFFSTSGRTGVPTPVFLTNYDLDKLKEYGVSDFINFAFRNAGIKKRVAQNTFPFAPHLAFWFSYIVARHLPKTFFYSFGTGRTELQADMIEKFKINILTGMPFYLKHLSEVAKDKEIKSRVKLVLLGGEGVPEGMKERIKNNLKSIGPEPVVKMTYASSEMKSVLMECAPSSGYHTHPELHYWEVVDKESLEPIGCDRPGVLVFSHLDSRGTVLLRYYTGDYVHKGITNKTCPHCGSKKPRITSDIERLVDMDKGLTSKKIKGNLVSLKTIDEVLSKFKKLKQYRVVITKKDPKDKLSMDELIIEAGIDKRVKNIKRVIQGIKNKFKAYTDITPIVKKVPSKEIYKKVMNTMKGVRVIDKRPT
ncbi:AMP-binding protein [archaeon]|nr:AMP-binding protein [archaeon]